MASHCLVAHPFETVSVSRVVECVTGERLQTIDELPICLTVTATRRRVGHPVAWVVSYRWAMHAEKAIRHCEAMGWE